jgi:hypothetical protein
MTSTFRTTMTHVLGAAALLLGLAAGLDGCASGGLCAGDYNGTWVANTTTDQIEFTSECKFNAHGADGCVASGSISQPLNVSGNVYLTISSSTGGDCLTEDTHYCTYAESASNLDLDCGSGTVSYHR